jgi:hypothetical protein
MLDQHECFGRVATTKALVLCRLRPAIVWRTLVAGHNRCRTVSSGPAFDATFLVIRMGNNGALATVTCAYTMQIALCEAAFWRYDSA